MPALTAANSRQRQHRAARGSGHRGPAHRSPGHIRRRGFTVDAIDVFCGVGGSSQGIHAAGATVLAAANHNPLAIECHARNFPDTEHWLADLVDTDAKTYLDPADLPSARFAWFSPACTHHTPANAKKVYQRGLQLAIGEDDDWDEQAFVSSERSRVTMSCVLRYVAAHHPECLVVENVVEVTKWGPGMNGATFRWWQRELRGLGYRIKLCFLNSMFFEPCPQSRDRLYIVAWRDGNQAPDLDYRPLAYCTSQRCGGRLVHAQQTWRQPTDAWLGMREWGKYLKQYDYRCPDCLGVVHPGSWMALSAIDFSNLGQTLGERKKLPAPATLDRITRALRKFWSAPPVLIPRSQDTPAASGTAATVPTAHAGTDDRARAAADPLPTLAQRNATGLVLFTKNNGVAAEAPYRGHHGGLPLGSLTAHPSQALVALVPNRTNNVARHPSDAIPPLTTATTEALLVTPESPPSGGPLDATLALWPDQATSVGGVATLRGDHCQDQPLSGPLTTVSGGGRHHALVTAAFSKINGGAGDTTWHGLHEPLNTVTGRDTHGLVLLPWIDQWRSEPALITEQLATVTARLRHSLASIEPYDGPISNDLLMQVRFRMLRPDPELRRAMAFPDDYQLLGTDTQKTAGLGQAVCPPVAAWLTARCLDTLRGGDPPRR